jgi:hypothetical protein
MPPFSERGTTTAHAGLAVRRAAIRPHRNPELEELGRPPLEPVFVPSEHLHNNFIFPA